MNEQKLRDILYKKSEIELLRDELKKIFLIANKTMDIRCPELSYNSNDDKFYIKNKHEQTLILVDDDTMKNTKFTVLCSSDDKDKFMLIGLSEIKKILEIFDSISDKLLMRTNNLLFFIIVTFKAY